MRFFLRVYAYSEWVREVADVELRLDGGRGFVDETSLGNVVGRGLWSANPSKCRGEITYIVRNPSRNQMLRLVADHLHAW
jgi:hypothetical protein